MQQLGIHTGFFRSFCDHSSTSDLAELLLLCSLVLPLLQFIVTGNSRRLDLLVLLSSELGSVFLFAFDCLVLGDCFVCSSVLVLRPLESFLGSLFLLRSLLLCEACLLHLYDRLVVQLSFLLVYCSL